MSTAQKVQPGTTLTPRELEVLRLLCKGYSLKEITQLMTLTMYTVADHIKAIHIKLQSSTLAEAAYRAGVEGLC